MSLQAMGALFLTFVGFKGPTPRKVKKSDSGPYLVLFHYRMNRMVAQVITS